MNDSTDCYRARSSPTSYGAAYACGSSRHQNHWVIHCVYSRSSALAYNMCKNSCLYTDSGVSMTATVGLGSAPEKDFVSWEAYSPGMEWLPSRSVHGVVRMNEAPIIEIHIVKSGEAPGGIGEPGTSALAPAVTNAIYAATGKCLRKLPVDGAQLKA